MYISDQKGRGIKVSHYNDGARSANGDVAIGREAREELHHRRRPAWACSKPPCMCLAGVQPRISHRLSNHAALATEVNLLHDGGPGAIACSIERVLRARSVKALKGLATAARNRYC